MATVNSSIRRAGQAALVIGIGLAVAAPTLAGETGTNDFAARAKAEFSRAQSHYQSDTNDVKAAWEFARAGYNFADYISNSAEHAAVARQAIAAGRQAIALEPDSAPAHYYLGLSLGQLARTETLAALTLVREMEQEFKTAARLDGHFDYAGPERYLGILYRDAPGWPVSIGSRNAAREWLELADRLAAEYPENHLNLVESHLQWHERDDARRELEALDALWPSARTNLVGPAWDRSWADWSARREAARKRLAENSPSAVPTPDAR
jgi:tetratricopeptide (TPR) repeat protein